MTRKFPKSNAGCAARLSGFRRLLVTVVSSLAVRGFALVVRAYQLTVSPAQTFLFGSSGGCRFTPTCSAYAVEAVRSHGAVTGTVLAAKRICRCHPWGGCGHDPVPESGKRKAESKNIFHPAHS